MVWMKVMKKNIRIRKKSHLIDSEEEEKIQCESISSDPGVQCHHDRMLPYLI